MRDVLRRRAKAQRPLLHTLSAGEARLAYETGSEILEIPKPALARVADFNIPTRDGQTIAARLYAPSSKDPPVLLYFHGGGFTIGSIVTHDTLCRQLCHLSGCAVMSVDYRLAPEYKFPTAAQDAWDSLQWLAAHADEMGLDARRLAVGGDSAGGTLAAICAISARNASLPLALQLLFYPGCAPHQDSRSHHLFGQSFILDTADITWFFNHYLRSPADRVDWRFAPLCAEHLEDVAPAWLGLAECDPLVDEGVMYGDRLRVAGVAVELEIYRGVTHEFIKMGRIIPQARHAHADAARALCKAFHLKHLR